MSRVRSTLQWVFLRGPAAFYELADSSPGLVSVLVLVALATAGGLGAGIGALIAVATARPLSPAFAFSGIKVIPATTFTAWRKTRDKRFFAFTVKSVQARYRLRQDGDPGPVTMAKLEQFGYVITA